nr:hypothetical protein [Rhizobium azibense]
MWIISIGAIFIICGILLLCREALDRRPLSDPHQSSLSGRTLEPRSQGVRFLGLTRNWLGAGLIAAGAAFLSLVAFM